MMTQSTFAAQSKPASGLLPSAPPRKRSYTWLYVLIVSAAVVTGAVFAYRQSKKIVKPTPIVTEKAFIKTVTQLVSATGKIQPEVEVKISPEVAGEIVEFPFKEGDPVKKGDLLVKIKPDNYVYQVEQREADLAAARASSLDSKSRLEKATADFHRNEDLYKKKLISESDYTSSLSLYEVAQAAMENTQAQIRGSEGLLKQARDLLTKTTVTAPIDGTVSSRTSELGERVVGTGQFAGTEVMRVANLDNMEVRVNVNENDVVNVKVGDRARVTIDAFPNRKFTGLVKEIASTAKTQGANTQEEITNFEVKIRVREPGVPLRPGMSANADIETQTVTDVVVIPIQAVTTRTRIGDKTIEQLAMEREQKNKQNQGEGAATAVNEKQQRERERTDREALHRVVFVPEGDHVNQVSVETGIEDSTHIQIKSGLKDGDEVVTGSFAVVSRQLKDGMKVKRNPPDAGGKKS